jgi:predicted HicB family RNase H-like nuclease
MMKHKGYTGEAFYDDEIKMFSGKFSVRVSPDLHCRIYIAAKEKKCLNAWVAETLAHVVG